MVGSALFVAVAWCVRAFRSRVLGIDPREPERWRLGAGVGTGAGADAVPIADRDAAARA